MSNLIYQSTHTGAEIDEAISKIPNLEQQINDLDADKVDKVSGKGLSTNDYTNEEKQKLLHIAANATKVADSTTNGNILINDQEVKVYDDADINSRIDEIIVTPVEGVSAQEILDARQGKASLGANLTSVKAQINDLDAEVTAHLADGASHSKTARFVVGTSTAGWTLEDCDYLCDGTNDTTIINSAIQALPATGGEIILLDGIYTVQNPAQTKITLKSNVLLRGNGVGTIIQPPLNYQYAQNLIQVSGNNVSICNLAIKSNGTHSLSLKSIETSTGISSLRIQYCYLELDIAFRQGSDFLIADNKFEASSLSLIETVTLSKIRGNSFFSAKYNGVSLTKLSSSIVAGNLIQDFGEARSGIVLGTGTLDYGSNIIANNIIRQTTEGSSIGINIDGSGSKKNLVMGNHIVGVKTGIRDVGSDNVIEYNIIN
jgi:hypothetical protein